MGRRIVTSIRLDAELIQKATVFGLNISKVTEKALEQAIRELEPNVAEVVPKGVSGFSDNTRILMADDGKFRRIVDVEVGERVVSYNDLTGRCEEANVIDVRQIGEGKTYAIYWTFIDNIGTKIEALPFTRVYCWEDSSANADWTKVEDIRPGYGIPNISGYYRKSGPVGSTIIKQVKEHICHGVFYRLEVYPHNTFFANSNKVRKLHFATDMLPAAWGFPVKGFPGQIGSLLDRARAAIK